MGQKHFTSMAACFELRLPYGTFVSLERRGAIGPFERDSSGRRLLSSEDIERIRQWMAEHPRPRAVA